MKKRVDYKKVVLIIVFIIALISTTVYFSMKDIHAKYKEYDHSNKLVGEIKNFEEDGNAFYTSIFYPSFGIETLDAMVVDSYKKDIEEQKGNKDKDTLYMDYQTSECFGQYISVVLDFKRITNDDDIAIEKKEIFTYDKKQNKVLTIKDVFRNKYEEVLSLLSQKSVSDLNLQNASILLDKDNIHIYYDSKDSTKNICVSYDKVKSYLALSNRHVNPNAPIDVKTPVVQPNVDPNKPMIAFTLDDGPHKTNTERTLSLFEKYNGRATFFMLGSLVKRYPTIVKDVYERGFEIANHSWDHANLSKLTKEQVEQQIYDTQDAIYSITGKDPTLVRPPYGAVNPIVKSSIKEAGATIMLWTVDTLDWKTKNAIAVKNAILKDVYDGAVILLHDIHTTSIDGLELALPILKQQGYQFVTIDTLQQYRSTK